MGRISHFNFLHRSQPICQLNGAGGKPSIERRRKKRFFSPTTAKLFPALRFTGVPRHDTRALRCIALNCSALHCPSAPAAALNLLPCDSLFLPGKSETSDEKKSESRIGGNLHLFFTGQIPNFWPTNLTIHELTGPKKDVVCEEFWALAATA